MKTDRHTDGEKNRQTVTWTDKEMDGQTGIKTVRQADGQVDRQTVRQKVKGQTGRWREERDSYMDRQSDG